MIKNTKDKGRRWENELAELLNERVGGQWKRVPGSGALGTQLSESTLTGDVNGKLDYISKGFKLEAKVGYGGAKQLTVKKDWLDKIKSEAEFSNSYPITAIKFSNARSGIRYALIFDFDTFANLMREVEGLYNELVRLYEDEHRRN